MKIWFDIFGGDGVCFVSNSTVILCCAFLAAAKRIFGNMKAETRTFSGTHFATFFSIPWPFFWFGSISPPPKSSPSLSAYEFVSHSRLTTAGVYNFNEIIFAQVNEQVKYWLFVESWQSGKKVFLLCCVRMWQRQRKKKRKFSCFVSGCVSFFWENEIEILWRFYVLNETERITEHQPKHLLHVSKAIYAEMARNCWQFCNNILFHSISTTFKTTQRLVAEKEEGWT